MIPDSAAVTDDRILGIWQDPDSAHESGPITVEKGRNRDYLITVLQNDSLLEFNGRLGRVNGRLVLDIAYADSSIYWSLGKAWPAVLTHSLMLVTIERDTLRVDSHNSDSVRAAFRRGRIRLPYTTLPTGDLVVGESTERLWRAMPGFLALHLKTDGPWAVGRVAAP